METRVEGKWSGLLSSISRAAMEIEMQETRSRPIGLAHTFKLLGALGQSQMTKIEFGNEAQDWFHGARYPRLGTASYPDFDVCSLICESFIELAETELTSKGKC